MIKFTSSLFLAGLLALGLHVASAQAQLVRTCVSMAKGNDANSASNCHCTTPCRTFAVAHANTFSDGEITVLDPGDYGGLTITKSISINNDSGGEASITVSGGATGIIVNAPAGGYVNLRGITIQGVEFGGGGGLTFNTGLFLTLTNCAIRNHTHDGIFFAPNALSNLSVSNTLVADNGGSGIRVLPHGSGSARVTLSRVEANNNSANGILFDASLTTGEILATVADSVVANNNNGIYSRTTQGISNVLVVRSVISTNRAVGLVAERGASGTATLVVGQSTVTWNATTWMNASATLLSFGDNNIFGNFDVDPAPPTTAKK